MYDEADWLALAGLQHFAFCPRQWALIHVEGLWQENLRTVEGAILHDRAHDGTAEGRRNVVVSRGLPVFSATLGVRGVCDVVEFVRDAAGVPLHGREGRFRPVPVEYKRGRPKEGDEDALQLCAQALCLEEMLACAVPRGFLYYGQTRHRQAVPLDDRLRDGVRAQLARMHDLSARRHTPAPRPAARCRACSLADLCLPRLVKRPSVADYLNERLGEDD